MNETSRPDSLSRILVALDTSRASQSALETAAILAEAMQCELSGLFVEDSDLLAVASLPFANEVRVAGGAIRKLDAGDLEREIQSHVAAARSALQRVAVKRHLSWSFRSVRGNVRHEVTAAASSVDILCIGQHAERALRRSRPGGTVQRALHGQAPVLIANNLAHYMRGPIAVVYDGSAGAITCARLGAQIAQRTRNEFVILLHGAAADDGEAVRNSLTESAPQGPTPRIMAFDPCDPLSGPHSVYANELGLVICSVKPDQPTPAWLECLFDVVGCPLLLVPERPA